VPDNDEKTTGFGVARSVSFLCKQIVPFEVIRERHTVRALVLFCRRFFTDGTHIRSKWEALVPYAFWCASL